LEWQNKAELAITKQRDDLAKEAIEQKLSCEEHVAELTRRVTELTGMIEQYQSDVARLEEKLDSAKRRQKTIIATHKQAVNRRKVEDKIYQINTSGAFNRFEQYQQKIDRYNAEAEVTAVANQSLEKKFKDLESENRVEAELARMKAVHTAAAPPEPPADASSESQSS
jgi:phage shock protein A